MSTFFFHGCVGCLKHFVNVRTSCGFHFASTPLFCMVVLIFLQLVPLAVSFLVEAVLLTSFVCALSLACARQLFLKAALVLICTSLSLRVCFCSGATEGNVRTCVDFFVLHGGVVFLQLVALVKHIQWLTHHHAADFRRRVTEVLQQFHYRLLLICRRSSRIKLIDMPFSDLLRCLCSGGCFARSFVPLLAHSLTRGLTSELTGGCFLLLSS